MKLKRLVQIHELAIKSKLQAASASEATQVYKMALL
jgi:hypothetical protein